VPRDLAGERKWLNSEGSLLTAGRKSAEGIVGGVNEPGQETGWSHSAEGPNGRKGEVTSWLEMGLHPLGS